MGVLHAISHKFDSGVKSLNKIRGEIGKAKRKQFQKTQLLL